MQNELHTRTTLRTPIQRSGADRGVWLWLRTHAPAFQPENAGEEKTVPHHHQSISAAVANRGIFQVQKTAV